MESLTILGKSFAFAFSALLPVIDPIGSALVFLALVGKVPGPVYRNLARKIGIGTALFLVAVEMAGAGFLSLFGLSLPVVQVSGGLVLAGMGWSQLNQTDYTTARDQAQLAAGSLERLERKIFYPLTFPVTAGPGAVVVMLTLSAHFSDKSTLDNVMAHLGIVGAVAALSALVFLSYAYAPKITERISDQTERGVERVISFVLLCIGVQIAWNGLESMLKTLLRKDG